MPAPIRKQLKRREIPGHARYLTFSCFNRQPLLGTPDARDAFANQLFQSRARLGFDLVAWVVMPEHVHLLVVPRPPELTVAEILSAIKRPVSAALLPGVDARRFDVVGPGAKRCFWQRGGGYDRNIFSRDELNEKIEYVHRNPCRRGLVERPEDWAWSSARALAGMETAWPEFDRVVL